MKSTKRVLALLLSVVMIGTFFIGCEKRDQDEESIPSVIETETIVDDEKTIRSVVPSLTEQVHERVEENDDTIGWLRVPLTSVDDVVVYSNQDNEYYKRRNFNKEYEFNGVYYADYRSPYTEEDNYNGTADSLPINNVIYGHAMTDNPEKEDLYSVKFGPLHDLRDPDFATDVPYMFYSSGEEDFVYEIFALLVVNSDNPAVPYNYPMPADQKEFYNMIEEEVLPRSVLNYDVELNEDDKYMTLSTCIYHLPGEEDTELPYPNYFRYAVMGRLVTDLDQPLKETVKVEINDDLVVDPNGPMASKK